MTTDTASSISSVQSDIVDSIQVKQEAVHTRLINQSFPKRLRLRKRGQFLRVQRIGRRVYTPHLIAYISPNNGRATRLGITVSKKVGKAYLRNRVKRILREAFRRSILRSTNGFDLSVIARKERPPTHLNTLINELNQLAKGADRNLQDRRLKKKHKPRSSNKIP